MSFPAIISEEMRLAERPVPSRLPDCLYSDDIIQLARDAFLFTTPSGTRFHYRRGAGIAVDKAGSGSDEETDLFYHGTVYGGVAWLNGLVPLHASSVVIQGKVVAFTGDSGEGKSTLAAALARHGYSHRSDDVLLVEISGNSIVAWPDRDRIKLCSDAFAMVGASRHAPVEAGSGKFFAAIDHCDPDTGGPLPLTDLIVLETAKRGEPRLEACTGSAKIPHLIRAMYRMEIPVRLEDGAAHASLLRSMGTGLRVWTLRRQRNRDRFEEDIALIARRLSAL